MQQCQIFDFRRADFSESNNHFFNINFSFLLQDPNIDIEQDYPNHFDTIVGLFTAIG